MKKFFAMQLNILIGNMWLMTAQFFNPEKSLELIIVGSIFLISAIIIGFCKK